MNHPNERETYIILFITNPKFFFIVPYPNKKGGMSQSLSLYNTNPTITFTEWTLASYLHSPQNTYFGLYAKIKSHILNRNCIINIEHKTIYHNHNIYEVK